MDNELNFVLRKIILEIQWNLLITDTQGTGQNGRYVQVTAIDR